MIMVCGGIADAVTELVCARLEECGYPYRLLDLGAYPSGYAVKWHWEGEHPTGYIAGPGWRCNLDELTGVYVRYLGPEGRDPIPNVDPRMVQAIHAECDSSLTALLEYLPCTVVNRSAGAMSNHSKPYQALLIRECGLAVPRTLVTNDPAEARRFYDECNGEAIFKSLSGVRSIVRRIGPEHLKRLPLLQHGPAQFQEFIRGDDIRVHTVGDQSFATRLHSEAVDYRYAGRDGFEVEMIPITLPPPIAEACLRAARKFDLMFAGIDLKVTADGEYYCFEVNPSPAFIYYEQGSRQPISTALADLLLKGGAANRLNWYAAVQ
jgi:glutathione synthase/RimK-type ligase-like ATP-grasp enzyme